MKLTAEVSPLESCISQIFRQKLSVKQDTFSLLKLEYGPNKVSPIFKIFNKKQNTFNLSIKMNHRVTSLMNLQHSRSGLNMRIVFVN